MDNKELTNEQIQEIVEYMLCLKFNAHFDLFDSFINAIDWELMELLRKNNLMKNYEPKFNLRPIIIDAIANILKSSDRKLSVIDLLLSKAENKNN